MCKKFLLFVGLFAALTLVPVSYGGTVVIGDFEGGLDGFSSGGDVALNQSTTGVTSGSGALEVNPEDTYTGGFSWAFQVDNSGIFAAAAQGPNPRLVADVTVIPSEWGSDGAEWDIWLQLENVAIQGDGIGWTEFGSDGGSFSVYGDELTNDIHQKTITWDLSAVDWTTLPSSPNWAQVLFATNFGTNGGTFSSIGNFYFDNIRIETDDAQGPSLDTVLIADFEGGLGSWTAWDPFTFTATSTGATTGSGAMEIAGDTGGWMNNGLGDLAAGRELLGRPGAAISMDITAFDADMTTSWFQVFLVINAQSDDSNGANNNVGWRDVGGNDISRDGVPHTYTFEIPQALIDDISATDNNIGWFELVLVSNLDGASTVKYYVDNIVVTAPKLISPWHRFECEDGLLEDTYYVYDDADCSGGQYVQLEKDSSDAANGQITITVKVRDAGPYPMRIGQSSAGDLERYALLTINGVQIGDVFSGLITWPVADAVQGVNSWDDEAVITDLFASVVLYGDVDGDWQLWDRWATEWDNVLLNTPMTVDLVEGENTINIWGTWAWDRFDFIELDLGYLPTNPDPEDGGIAIIADGAELSWDNALADLDTVEVWFGETPVFVEGDPNTVVTSENYKDMLTLIDTISSPGGSSSTPAPAMAEGLNYTWVVDGTIEGNVDANDLFYGGPFWTFMATAN